MSDFDPGFDWVKFLVIGMLVLGILVGAALVLLILWLS